MDNQKDQRESEKEIDRLSLGDKRYGRMVRMFREGYLSLCIYKNVYEKRVFYDIVIYRKIKVNGKLDYKRGANLKPSDILVLVVLLKEADGYLNSIEATK